MLIYHYVLSGLCMANENAYQISAPEIVELIKKLKREHGDF